MELGRLIDVLLAKYFQRADKLCPISSASDALLYSFIAGVINDLLVLKKCDELLNATDGT